MDDGVLAFGERAPSADRPLRVGVLVDLPLGPRAGGHVRCWERLAEAARGFPDQLDLTVHFAGTVSERCRLAETVRYVIEPPVFSTERLGFLSHVPDHTDLAPWHRRLERHLPRYDVIHTTDGYFAYARTALRFGARHGIPVVNSVHTNTPEYARVFMAQTVERLFGAGPVGRALLTQLRLAHRVEASMLRRLAAHQSRCDFVLVSRPDQVGTTRARLGDRVGLLRRGIDHLLFHPGKRNRPWLAAAYGIPPERLVVIYVGRLNCGKNVLFLVDAISELLARGVDAHLLCIGDGDDRATILRRLGSRASCPGCIEPLELARHYASADVFAFPSLIEESANVLPEALASGLPVLVAREGGMGRVIAEGETGRVLPGNATAPWSDAVAMFAADSELRRRMGVAARRRAERAVPSWSEVLRSDLLPVWQAVAGYAHVQESVAAE